MDWGWNIAFQPQTVIGYMPLKCKENSTIQINIFFFHFLPGKAGGKLRRRNGLAFLQNTGRPGKASQKCFRGHPLPQLS